MQTINYSFRMPTDLKTAIAIAVQNKEVKNQTEAVTRAVQQFGQAILSGNIHDVLTQDTTVTNRNAKMVSYKFTERDIQSLKSLASRLYLPTSKLILWALSRQYPTTSSTLPVVPPTDVKIRMSKKIKQIFIGASGHLPKFLVGATEMLIHQIEENVPTATLLLSFQPEVRTNQHVKTIRPEMSPELVEAVATTAPKLYRSINSFVIWAGLLAATEK